VTKFLLDANLSPQTSTYLSDTFHFDVTDLQSRQQGNLPDEDVVLLGIFLTFGEYCLLAKEGATIGTAGVQAWVRGASGGCGASSDGDARIGL